MSRNAETVWEGKYLRMVKDGTWEYVERARGIGAVVILAEHDGKVILVEQERVPLGKRCIELPAGLVGDEDDAGVEETALKELEEETGFIASRIERLGQFYSSPGMVGESFELVRAHGVRSGGRKSEEDIQVHLVAREDMAEFVVSTRERGLGIDVKMLLLLAGEIFV